MGRQPNSGRGVVPGSRRPGRFPLSVGANKRFQTASGVPDFMLVYTAWDLLINLTQAEIAQVIATIKSLGFTGVLVEVPEHYFTINSAPQNVNGDVPFTTPGDFSTPNAAYWAHVDAGMAKLAAADLAVWVEPGYMGYNAGPEGWYANGMVSSGATKLQNYGAFFAGRYQALQNLIWVAGGDFTPSETALFSAMVTGLQSASNPKRLITAHWSGSDTTPYATALQPDAPLPNWDLQAIYTWASEPSAIIAAAGSSIKGIIEWHYDHYGSITIFETTAAAWASYLGGCAWHTHGDENTWPFGATGFGTSTNWAAYVNYIGAQAMSILKGILMALNWSALTPDASHVFVTAGYGSAGTPGYVPVAATLDGNGKATSLVAHVPNANTAITVDKSKIAGAFTAVWRDPYDGSTVSIGTGIAASGSANYSRATANSQGGTNWVWVGTVP